MKLGTWHHRPGGKWRVWRSDFVLWKIGPLLIRGYQWTADSDATVEIMRGKWFGGLEINPCDDGHVACYWLARRRAIAALRRMRTTQGGQ